MSRVEVIKEPKSWPETQRIRYISGFSDLLIGKIFYDDDDLDANKYTFDELFCHLLLTIYNRSCRRL